MFDIQRLLDRLEKVQKASGGWTARCPAHDDKDPSLSIAQAEDGRILIHCHSGCPPLDVVHAVGFELKDLFPDGAIRGWIPGAGLAERRRAHKKQQSDETVLAMARENRDRGVKLSQKDLALEREAFLRQRKRRQTS